MGFFSFLLKSDSKAVPPPEPVLVDMHSHFLPGIDDGATNLEECLKLLKTFEDRGFKKIITTPHIIQDLYENTPETILPVLEDVKKALKESGSGLEIHAAAEYFMDENFIQLLETDAPLLTLKDKLVLVETGFMNEPANLREIFFKMRLKGYKPVFAHPERYMFLQNRKEKLEELFDSGVYLQINTMSLGGYYGLPALKLAEWMIEQGFVHFLGSDCHRERHLEPLAKAYKSKAYKKLREMPLLNDTLF
jgi:protein-tyrosine phosphatase